MTAIIGYSDGETIWIGADSAIAYDDSYTEVSVEPKIYRHTVVLNGAKVEMLLGFAGDVRHKQYLLYVLGLPAKNSGYTHDPELEFIIKDLVPVFLRASKELTTGDTSEDGDSPGADGYGSSVVIGINGRVFVVDSGLSVIEHPDNVIATGSARELCRTSIYSILEAAPKINIESAILIALKSAHTAQPGSVQPPFRIETVSKKGGE